MIEFLRNSLPDNIGLRFEKDYAVYNLEDLTGLSVFEYVGKDSALLIIQTGSFQCIIDGKELVAKSPCLMHIMPGAHVDSISHSTTISGKLVLLSLEFCESLGINNSKNIFVTTKHNCIIPIQEKSLEPIIAHVKLIESAVASNSRYKRDLLKHLTMAYYYGNGLALHEEFLSQPKNHDEKILTSFSELFKENYREIRDVSFYASQLCLSPDHLCRIIKKYTGKTPSKIIESYVILQIKEALSKNDYSLKDIAEMFHFSSTSDLCKYFKKGTTVSPLTYRRLLKQI